MYVFDFNGSISNSRSVGTRLQSSGFINVSFVYAAGHFPQTVAEKLINR